MMTVTGAGGWVPLRTQRAGGVAGDFKIAFVRPNLYPERSGDALEPQVFGILKALTPPEVSCVLHDERLAPVPVDEGADLVAMTVETYTARRAYQLARAYHARGVPVVMGGYHPTLLPEEALQYADAIVRGDAEAVWPQIVADARQGRLRRVYDGGYPDLAGLRVDRSIFAGQRYGRLALVQFGRGCRYVCDFCSIAAFYGKNLRQRPVEAVVRELAELGERPIFFADDNLFVSRASAQALFQALKPLRVRWACQASMDIADDPALVRLMAEAGCMAVTVGFESLDRENLKQMKKAWNRGGSRYDEAIRVFHDAGIMIYGTFVLGYDHDGPEAFDVALDFALRSKFFLANFNPLTPTPGAPLLERLRREGRLLRDRWWLDPRYRYGQALFRPARMTPAQLEEGCYRARTAFNTYVHIARRALDTRMNLRSLTHAAVYWSANLISRREIHRKQGRCLGGPEALEPIHAQVPTLEPAA